MAIFTLTDITFTGGEQERTGMADPYIAGANYENNLYKYPLDIGSYDKGHYVLIHINMQEQTSFPRDLMSDNPTIIQNRLDFGSPSLNQNIGTIIGAGKEVAGAVMNSEYMQKAQAYIGDLGNQVVSKVASINPAQAKMYTDAVNSAGIGKVVNGLINDTSDVVKNYTSVNTVRTIRRTSDTIALYMPQTVNFINSQNYSDVSNGSSPISAAAAAGASAVDQVKSGKHGGDIASAIAKNLSAYFASYALNRLGSMGKAAFAAGFGVVENPMLELLYTSPQFREFRFDFMFYPRSEKEGLEVQKILNRLQFHQAPEVSQIPDQEDQAHGP